jgi:hypothetical protein
MMRRLAFAVLLAIAPSIALAAEPLAFITPTAPPGTNNNRIASTAFVQNAVGGGSGITALTGDAAASGPGSATLTLATVNANVGTFGSATSCVTVTNNAKGLTTAISAATCTPAVGSITGFGTGVATALAVNTGTAGSFVVNGGALGTPSSGVLTNATGLPVATGISGLGTGVATALGNAVNASGGVQGFDPQLSSLIRQNSQSTNYTTVLTDSGKHILHPSADTTARTFTIDSNANVAYPIGTAITFVNQNGAGVVTIAITSDTMRLAGAGTTGSRTLAANGTATALKITATEWIITGTGLT